MLANLILLVAGVGLGIFCAVFPERAAKRWGGDKIAEVPPESRTAAPWSYRIFGIVFALACALFLLKILTA
jgi:hypothetical protein